MKLAHNVSFQSTDSATAESRPARFIYLISGIVLVGLGGLGLFLPGLPTTPFILLASWCFSRSSPKLQHQLEQSRLFGPLLRDWREHRAVRSSVRIWSLFLIVTMLAGTCLFSDLPWTVKCPILFAGCIGAGVVFRLPVIPTGELRKLP